MGERRNIVTSVLAVIVVIEYAGLSIILVLSLIGWMLSGNAWGSSPTSWLVSAIGSGAIIAGLISSDLLRTRDEQTRAHYLPWLLAAASASPVCACAAAFASAMVGGVMLMGLSNPTPVFACMVVDALVGACFPYAVVLVIALTSRPGSEGH